MRAPAAPLVSGSRRGQALLLTTVCLVAMFGMLGLVVDIGWAYFRRHAAQAAADAAALAAAQAAAAAGGSCASTGVACQAATPCPAVPAAPPADNAAAGCLYAAANGFRHHARQSVTIAAGSTSPAPGAPGVAVRYWVTAEVSESIPQLFSAALGNHVLTATARATAGVLASAENACLYVLDPDAKAAFSASGGAQVTTAGCEIYVNSGHENAMTVSGGARVTAGSVAVSGGYKVNGGGTIDPTPVTGAAPAPDPFADLPAPDCGPCTRTNYNVSGGSAVTLQPGIYCKGISISGQADVTFAPGVYVLNGGGLHVSGGATVAGSGVTFFNTSQGYSFGPVSMSGGAVVTLAAPTSGAYQGILFYQDRTLGSTQDSSFTGGSTMNLTGSLYLPNAGLKFAGGSGTGGPFTALLARTVQFTGNSKFKPDPTGEHTGLSRRTVSLIE